MSEPLPPPQRPRGRGAVENTQQRFAELHVAYDEGETPVKVGTKFFVDHSSTVITRNSSPDVGIEASLNPYRGCEHGCAYCFARPSHEYLGFSAGLEFESRILVKPRAAELLREQFCKKSWEPQVVAMSGITDVYQPIERKLGLTRQC